MSQLELDPSKRMRDRVQGQESERGRRIALLHAGRYGTGNLLRIEFNLQLLKVMAMSQGERIRTVMDGI